MKVFPAGITMRFSLTPTILTVSMNIIANKETEPTPIKKVLILTNHLISSDNVLFFIVVARFLQQ
jgi:hypothetical protein